MVEISPFWRKQDMVEPRVKLTVADYMATPDDEHYQLLDGELILAPSPTDRHQAIVGNIYFFLRQFVNDAHAGRIRVAPLDVVLAEHDVAQPDILFVSNERRSIITAANIQGAPDLLVEILSPSTQRRDRGYKQDLYARHGVGEYWLVDPEAETVEVLTLTGEEFSPAAIFTKEETLVSPLLPGLAIDLEKVFNE
jgi:Uma2 family endonuclease